VCVTWLKKLCRSYDINRWPYRKIQSLKAKAEKLTEMKACGAANAVSEFIKALQEETGTPEVTMPSAAFSKIPISGSQDGMSGVLNQGQQERTLIQASQGCQAEMQGLDPQLLVSVYQSHLAKQMQLATLSYYSQQANQMTPLLPRDLQPALHKRRHSFSHDGLLETEMGEASKAQKYSLQEENMKSFTTAKPVIVCSVHGNVEHTWTPNSTAPSPAQEQPAIKTQPEMCMKQEPNNVELDWSTLFDGSTSGLEPDADSGTLYRLSAKKSQDVNHGVNLLRPTLQKPCSSHPLSSKLPLPSPTRPEISVP